jgi:hypothetical protein
MGVSGQRHAPAALYPRRKDPRYPLVKRLGGPQSRSGRWGKKKNLDRPIVQPVVRHYTASATAAPLHDIITKIFCNLKHSFSASHR